MLSNKACLATSPSSPSKPGMPTSTLRKANFAQATRKLSAALVQYQEATVKVVRANQQIACHTCRAIHTGYELARAADKNLPTPNLRSCSLSDGRQADCPWARTKN